MDEPPDLGQLFHRLNNQLGIILANAELIEAKAADEPIRSRATQVVASGEVSEAAVVEDGRRVLSSVVASQVDVHHRYGGVVPELASRKHIEAILPVTQDMKNSCHCRTMPR